MSDSSPFRSPSDQPTNVRWRIFALACAASFLLYLHRYTWGFVKPDVQQQTGWSDSQLGWLDGVFHATYAAGQVPAGLCDRFGTRWLLAAIILLWSVSLGGVALAGRFGAMLLARAAFGLAQAGCYPALGKVTKEWIPWHVRTTAQGWIATFFGRFGGAVSHVVVGFLLLQTLRVDWHSAVLALAALGVLFAVLFALVFRSSPRQHPGVNADELSLIEWGQQHAPGAPSTRLDWRPMLQSRTVQLLCLQQALAVWADNFYVNWLVKYLRQELHVDAGLAGWQSFVPLTASAIGGPLAAVLQDRLLRNVARRRKARSYTAAGAFLMAGLLFLAALPLAHLAWGFVLVLTAAKFFADWGQPAVWGTVTDISGRNAASMFGLVNMCGSLGGLVVGPFSGWLLQRFSGSQETDAVGWQALFIFTVVTYGLLAMTWLFIDATRTVAEASDDR